MTGFVELPRHWKLSDHIYTNKGGKYYHIHCRDCGRFISYSNITKDFDGCYNCDPQAEWRDKI